MGRSARTVCRRGQRVLRAITALGLSLILALALVVAVNNAMPEPASAADTGFSVPSSYASIAGRTAFASPDWGRASDDLLASSGDGTYSESYYGFGFSVPSGATIDGIVVTVEGHSVLAGLSLDVSLSYDGGTSWTATKATGAMTAVDATYTLGGTGDNWGYGSWTRAIINSDSLRVRLDAPSGGQVYLDSVQARVYYTEATAPIIAEAATLYNSSENATVTQMSPQQEYAVKVTVADANTIDDLDTVTVTIFYDSNNNDSAGDIPAANTQTCFIMTCEVGSTPNWSQNPSSSTTWDIVETNCTQPTVTAGSGIFWFRFKPGKVATEAGDWDVYVVATDDSALSDTYYDVNPGNYDMLWYGEIDVSGTAPNWGVIMPGMDFNNAAAKESVEVNYISNGNYDAALSTTNWTGSGNTATLNTSGTPGANEFSMKAWSSDNLTAADLVTTTAADCVIDNTGDLTTESGDTNSNNTLYVKIGTPFMRGVYSGTITFYIRNR